MNTDAKTVRQSVLLLVLITLSHCVLENQLHIQVSSKSPVLSHPVPSCPIPSRPVPSPPDILCIYCGFYDQDTVAVDVNFTLCVNLGEDTSVSALKPGAIMLLPSILD